MTHFPVRFRACLSRKFSEPATAHPPALVPPFPPFLRGRPHAKGAWPALADQAPRCLTFSCAQRTRSLAYAMLAWYSCSERTPLAPFFLTSAMPSAVALAAAIVVM